MERSNWGEPQIELEILILVNEDGDNSTTHTPNAYFLICFPLSKRKREREINNSPRERPLLT